MNHQPFEEWLYDQRSLTGRQKSELQAHLRTCTSCSALAEVDLALRSTRVAAPAPGFSERFQIRLEQRKLALRRRNYWGFLLLALAVNVILAVLAWPLVAPLFHSPVNTLASWLSWLIALWTSLQAMGHVGELFFQVLPGFVPPVIWIVLTFGACGWGLLWVLSVRKFVHFTQGV